MSDPISTEEQLIAKRREKLEALRESLGSNPYRNGFKRDSLAGNLQSEYSDTTSEQLTSLKRKVSIAGRLMTQRIMGKASFAHVRDMTGDIQIYVKRDSLPEGVYQDFKKWDLGDIVFARGEMFRTQKGELSVLVDEISLVTKSLRPLPEKWHGLSDLESRYRQRYLDLIMSDSSRDLFRKRTHVINFVRQFLTKRDFLEVETPMMHPIPGGASARPFVTHHNSLDMDLFCVLRLSYI